MKTYIKHILCLSLCIWFLSCDDYLDVQPEDKYLEEQLFSTEEGVFTALNGIYAKMVAQSAYGGDLTMRTVELLGQRYNVGDNRHRGYIYANYLYEEEDVQNRFNSIWTSMYTNILNINNLLQGLEIYTGVLSDEEKALVEGEAHALRAMLHFDLLRLFGPVYVTNAEDDAIPYYTTPETEISEMLSAQDVVNAVLNDLSLAETLLENDPIRENGPMTTSSSDFSTNFFRYRNLRLNYFAVKALQARVNLYAGNIEAASSAANTVIDEASTWFPWVIDEEITSGGGSIDRIFSTEVLFGLQNTGLYNFQRDNFAASLNEERIYAASTARLEEDYESITTDYRFEYSWFVSTEAAKDYRTFFKFADIENKEKESRFMQPLIRISEMYYIAAETASSDEMALEYLNTVRKERGIGEGFLLELGVADVETEILKEYKKEFYGEGQMFFYYKRKNFSEIPDGSSADYITMSEQQYVVPLPLSETDFR
ncbi:RagB/SusD family nutrient uptake outer membrane protein [Aestuariibaculum marinum]|uniref:RagB/SusD family nutrient uptake outer membrane protein n=1 Tax=Aestuariibaculum marinum TaxID=2683592 RepID=A0A8J6PWB8_9FLAO|nr:RagB/SusD family nutrient uptake outer membrane protein [Aestuariibaculum marinum]MBD0824900.1 RagB/SusD family nutrient uptake outer membrane protein [Aestuariibaculum marinum]